MKLNTNIRPEKDTVKKALQYKFLAYGVVKADDDEWYIIDRYYHIIDKSPIKLDDNIFFYNDGHKPINEPNIRLYNNNKSIYLNMIKERFNL